MTVAANGARTGISIFIASRTTSGSCAVTLSPSVTFTPITVPGIGAVTVPWACVAAAGTAVSTSGAVAGEGGGRFSRHGSANAGGADRSGGADSGAWSARNAVVTEPSRNDGCRTSQSRNGRFVTTPVDGGGGERSLEPFEGLLSVGAGRDQLCEQRVVDEPDLVPLLHGRVDANPPGKDEPLDAPGLRQERPRILGVEPRFDGVAARRDVEVEVLTVGDAKLQLDDVESRQLLGDRMLDLDPAVELEEVDVGAVHEEFGRAGVPVADRLRERDGAGRDLRPGARIEPGSGGFLEQFLVPPLDRAVARAEDGDPAAVAEQLGFDMARTFEVSLAIHRGIAERSLRLASGGGKSFPELGGAANHAHPAAAAAGRGLDHDREADLLGRALGQRRYTGLPRDPRRCELVAAEPKRLRRRPDPRDAGRDDLVGKVGALGEKAVAGVDRIDAGLERRAHVFRTVQVRGDLRHPIGDSDVERASVVRRCHPDGLDPEPRAGTEDAERDLSAVGDEKPADRHGQTLCGRPYYPVETRATETSAHTTPTYCSRERRSRRTTPARTTVVTG